MHFRNKFIPYYQKLSFILYWFFNTFNPVQDGIFLGCSRMGWGIAKRPHLPKICCTYPTMMKHGTVIPYLKEIQNTPLYFCWHQHFFTGNQQILLYQGIQIQIPFRCITSNSSNFSWVFKDCFNKCGQNCDDVSKNGYLRPS